MKNETVEEKKGLIEHIQELKDKVKKLEEEKLKCKKIIFSTLAINIITVIVNLILFVYK